MDHDFSEQFFARFSGVESFQHPFFSEQKPSFPQLDDHYLNLPAKNDGNNLLNICMVFFSSQSSQIIIFSSEKSHVPSIFPRIPHGKLTQKNPKRSSIPLRRRWMRMARARLWLAATDGWETAGRLVILYTVDLMGIIMVI